MAAVRTVLLITVLMAVAVQKVNTGYGKFQLWT